VRADGLRLRHIGNFRAYVFEDILRRYLKYSGFRVTQVMNLTDIDDKTIRGARKAGISLNDFTRRYRMRSSKTSGR